MKPKRLLFIAITLTLVYCHCEALRACTVFVLTDAHNSLFCNNEDFINPKARMWFVPAVRENYGCVFVGFDDGCVQGGMNTEGLAYDGVGGYQEDWKPAPNLLPVKGSAYRQLLETCATVDDAIKFCQTHKGFTFYQCKILVADKSGDSVMIGAKDGRLQVEKANQCRGFGYGARVLDQMLATPPKATVANGSNILRACLQTGDSATKYSNIFDLKSADIFLCQFSAGDEVKLNLADELKKGGHYYDTPQIREQLTQKARPLLDNMKRHLLEDYQPIVDKEPDVTGRLRGLMQELAEGTMHVDDYTAALWIEVSKNQKQSQRALKAIGPLVSFTLVDRNEQDGMALYRYRMEFEKGTLLQRFSFDEQKKLGVVATEDMKWKPATKH